MPDLAIRRQFSLAYLLGEMALFAVAFAAGRVAFFPSAVWIETQGLCFCLCLTALGAAIGGLFLRMSVGFVVGGILAGIGLPIFWHSIIAS